MVLPWVLVLHPLIDKGESLEPGTLQAGSVKAVAIRFDLAFDLASDLVLHLVFHLVFVLVFVPVFVLVFVLLIAKESPVTLVL